MQTIKTRYRGATSTKPSKIIATSMAYTRGDKKGRVVVSYEHGIGSIDNHRTACEALREQLGWTAKNGYGAMAGGDIADGVVWVFVDDVRTEN
jgi:hypothetical protein